MKAKRIIGLFILTIFLAHGTSFAQSAESAIKALMKIKSRCSIGINYKDYLSLLGDTKAEVDMFWKTQMPAKTQNYAKPYQIQCLAMNWQPPF